MNDKAMARKDAMLDLLEQKPRYKRHPWKITQYILKIIAGIALCVASIRKDGERCASQRTWPAAPEDATFRMAKRFPRRGAS